MKRIAITGASGFIGKHLVNWLSLRKDDFQILIINKDDFQNQLRLDEIIQQADIVIHLAGKNRSADQNEIESININLSRLLVESLERVQSKPYVIISSSTQEQRENIYGNSKKVARELLSGWANSNDAPFLGLIIPNVFGPFAKPFYNTVVATFCFQLNNGEDPSIDIDASLQFIYIDELIIFLLNAIEARITGDAVIVPHTAEITVSQLLNKLLYFKRTYLVSGEFPVLQNSFDLNLFNTFRSYIDHENYFPRLYKVNSDARGVFVELARLSIGGQFSFSTTKVGIVRGNHFHTRKIERFAVISGKALIEMRKYGEKEVISFTIDAGFSPGYVDMPIWYIHNLKNIGTSELVTCFWINEPYNAADPDTYFELV